MSCSGYQTISWNKYLLKWYSITSLAATAALGTKSSWYTPAMHHLHSLDIRFLLSFPCAVCHTRASRLLLSVFSAGKFCTRRYQPLGQEGSPLPHSVYCPSVVEGRLADSGLTPLPQLSSPLPLLTPPPKNGYCIYVCLKPPRAWVSPSFIFSCLLLPILLSLLTLLSYSHTGDNEQDEGLWLYILMCCILLCFPHTSPNHIMVHFAVI